jgi:hypothetical protein
MNDPVNYMTPEELTACCADLSWGTTALSRATGIREMTINRWFTGNRHVPPPIADHIRLLAAFHRANPFPEDLRPGERNEQAIDRTDHAGGVHDAARGVRPHAE